MYRGWWPTIMRDVPFSAVYWYSFEAFRYPIRDMLLASPSLNSFAMSSSDGDDGNKKIKSMSNFLAGAASGFFSAFITHPWDVLKTRKQIDPTLESSTFGGIIRKEGIRGLMRGLLLRLGTVIPGGAIVVTVYEGVKDLASSKK